MGGLHCPRRLKPTFTRERPVVPSAYLMVIQHRSTGSHHHKLRFALDSPPEQRGFELLVPQSCQRQAEPDPAEMTVRHGSETPVLDWRERLVCSRCPQANIVVSATKRHP